MEGQNACDIRNGAPINLNDDRERENRERDATDALAWALARAHPERFTETSEAGTQYPRTITGAVPLGGSSANF